MARAGLVELRVLDGPNLYFARPAIKLTLEVAGWLALPEERTRAIGSAPIDEPQATGGLRRAPLADSVHGRRTLDGSRTLRQPAA